MTSRDFCYWLQGYFELRPADEHILNSMQVEAIRKHLNMVFIHEIDPAFPQAQQGALQEAHAGKQISSTQDSKQPFEIGHPVSGLQPRC